MPSIYDRVPYLGLPLPQTHPDRLGIIATLFGMSPSPADRCRVLELGCGDGGNLIPLALTLMRIATAHFSWSSNVLGIFGLPVFSYLLLRSKLRHARGRVAWKGRTYPGTPGIKPVS